MINKKQFQMKSIGPVSRIILILSLFVSMLGVSPASATSLDGRDSIDQGVSPQGYLNPDGTLKLSRDFSGIFDLAGWEVNADPHKGPSFARSASSPALISPVAGNWENLGGGVPMTFNGTVRAVAVLNNGDIVVGGDFTNLGEDPRMDYIARWDGTHWLPLGNSSLNSRVYALAVDGSGNLYVGGDFINVSNNGTVLNEADFIAKWDGTDWSALSSNGSGNGSLNGGVWALTVDGNGNLYVGGWFTNVNNNGMTLGAADYIVKWNGTDWSALGSNVTGNGSLNNVVMALAVDGNGNLYVGGVFTDVSNNGTVLGVGDYIAKWNGTDWSALGINGAGDGSLNNPVVALAVAGNGNLYVGGYFTDVKNNGIVLGAADYLAKWDGTDWSALGSNGVGDGSLNNPVVALAVAGDGNLYVGGTFTNVNNTGTTIGDADYIVKWNGTNWSALGSNGAGGGSLNNGVMALKLAGNGNLYVGGAFTGIYNGTNFISSPYFGAWDSSASTWYSLVDNSLSQQGASNNDVLTAVTDGNGNLYVGGAFINLNGIDAADYVAKWDGTAWSALGNNGVGGGSLSGQVRALAIDGNGNLYAGGAFSNVNNDGTVLDEADYVAKWDGTNWLALGSNGAANGSLNNSVNALAVDENGNLYVGGWFTNVNNNGTVLNAADYIAKWNGTNWSALGSKGAGEGPLNSLYSTVWALALDGSGNLYVGGQFDNAGGNGAADNIAKWDGTNWSALGNNGAGDGALNYMNTSQRVQALALDGNGNLYVGGYFVNVNNNGNVLSTADFVAKWDGTNWSALGSDGAGNGSLLAQVYALAVDGNGNVYVGGNFPDVENNGTVLGTADYVAKWDGTNWSALGSNGSGNGSLNSYVYALGLTGNELYVGGEFINVNNNGTVLNTADYIAAYGLCTSGSITVQNVSDSGNGSLRQAIADICSGGTINLDASLSGQTIVLASTLVLDKNLTIDGSALATKINISGNDSVRVLKVEAGKTITLKGLAIVHGFHATEEGAGAVNLGTLNIIDSDFSDNAAKHGGAIINVGTLNITDSVFANNSASTGSSSLVEQGGAILNMGATTIIGSIFSDNSTNLNGAGGGIHNHGVLNITDSTLIGNSAQQGGALNNNAGSTTHIYNSNFSENSADFGGAILNYETLEIETSIINANTGFIHGGGVANAGTLNLIGSTISNNTSGGMSNAGNGGGIYNSGTVISNNNSFISNTASFGGGISNDDAFTLINSSFFGNSANNGGGILNTSVIEITNTTLSENTAFTANGGGGIKNAGTMKYWNTIVANSTFGNDCYNTGLIETNINNLVEDNSLAPNDCGTPILTTDPGLVALADNGGPTPTMALGAGSPAIDAGNDTFCPATDQRGVARPQGGGCDIGAYEYQSDVVPPTVLSVTRASASPTDLVSVNFTVTFSEPVTGVDVDDFSLTASGVSGASITGVSGSGTMRTVTVNTGSGNGTIRLNVVDDDSIRDAANNPLGGVGLGNGNYTSGEAYMIQKDTTSPQVVSITRAQPSPTNLASVNFTVTFSESVTGVNAGDFSLTAHGVTGASITGVSGSGATRTVTVNTGSGNGTIRLNVVDDDSIRDAANNPLGGVGLGNGNYTGGETYTILKNATFEDVPDNYWAWSFIERLFNAGITGGCSNSPLNYCPESEVTRAQMAVFLLRGIHGSTYSPPLVGGSTGFGDVPTDYWAAAWIKQLAAEGITGGCGSGNYCPEAPVTRAQMAVFLLRSKHGSTYSPPNVGGSTGFGDVPTDYWAAAWIKQLVGEAITSGCGGGNYCPEASVTRAQMAVFLVKTFGLP